MKVEPEVVRFYCRCCVASPPEPLARLERIAKQSILLVSLLQPAAKPWMLAAWESRLAASPTPTTTSRE